MNKQICLSAMLFLFLYSFISCKKQKEPDASNALYTFTNHLNQPITVKIFPDSGWSNDLSTYLHIAPGQKGVVPTKIFYQWSSIPSRLQYYWVTDDNQFSNWGMQPLAKFNYDPAVHVRNFDIIPSDGDGRMRLFLKHIDSNTVWKMIDVYDSTGKSIWNTMLPNAQKYELQFNCFTGSAASIGYLVGTMFDRGDDFHFNITTSSGYYDIQSEKFAEFAVRPNSYVHLTNNYKPMGLVTARHDRLFMIFDDKPPVYLMAKQ
jgi:hypothetical protein